jgi:hypothetical protein
MGDINTGAEFPSTGIESALRHLQRPRSPLAGIPQYQQHNSTPLSYAQERLWFLDQFEPGSPFYNVPMATRIAGSLSGPILERCFNEIVRRHEALRTHFGMMDGRPVQIIEPILTLRLEITDLRRLVGSEREEEARRIAQEEALRGFDLTQGPLVRTRLVRMAEADQILLITMHHIVSDGWSMGVFFRELSTLYQAYSVGRESPLPELPIQYVDFAQWQREWLQGEVLAEHVGYWKKHLEGAPGVLELPTDRPRPAVQSFRGATYNFRLGARLQRGLKELSRQEGTTLFMTLLAGFKALLSRYTGQPDIVVGTPIANRTRAELEGLIGFFVNTLVLRSTVEIEGTFRDLLRQVREVTLGAYAHQDLPFEKLVEELQPERNLSWNPLFQVMFLLQNDPATTAQAAAGERASALSAPQVGTSTAKFDLVLGFVESASGLIGGIEYNTDLFDADRIERMAGHLEVLLEAVVRDADTLIAELPLMKEQERRQVIEEWNRTEQHYPNDRCVHELFEEQVERRPDAVAIEYEDEQLSYRELNERANQVAHHLRERDTWDPESRRGLPAAGTKLSA